MVESTDPTSIVRKGHNRSTSPASGHLHAANTYLVYTSSSSTVIVESLQCYPLSVPVSLYPTAMARAVGQVSFSTSMYHTEVDANTQNR